MTPDGLADSFDPGIGPMGTGVGAPGPLRAAITAAYRRAEGECLGPLLDVAALPGEHAGRAEATARMLVERLRAKGHSGGVEGLIHEYALSSQEGVALMCLAEALLRIPDTATRDALIRDKISTGDWRAHVGHSPSLFVNAATWGLVLTGRLTASASEATLGSHLTRLIARGGEPVIRRGVDMAMRMMGGQFVTGETIGQALVNARKMEARGFSYSYDMLGEAAMTAEDAARYLAEYEGAIHAIGRASAGRGPIAGPGISIKLSALHPRYSRAQQERVRRELLPRIVGLAGLAKGYGIGLNIDAEESDRLELSLDLLEALAVEPGLSGWDGLGFVVQAYGKRAPFVIDWVIDLARRAGRRIMVRLVKGAYWDSEIKRAQVDGMADYPVFTRKLHTDVSYLASARMLLGAPEAVYPQFATHNAQTLAAVLEGGDLAAGEAGFRPGQYEFQCLHGMGEPLYEEVVGAGKLGRPCRIYAPVGTHETLLAYLVRRLLENGANSSFVNRIGDAAVPVDELVADPVALVRSTNPKLAPHGQIGLPGELYGPARSGARGFDLSDENSLAVLAAGLTESAGVAWAAAPDGPATAPRPVLNPADHRDVVGHVQEATGLAVEQAVAAAVAAGSGWAETPPAARAAMLCRAADALEARMPVLIGLIGREAGKSFANAVAEVREAVDFLRYYRAEAVRTMSGGRYAPLGPVVCISPWNFPLAIFAGQVAAALAAGNTVLAKPAEETPLIAAEAVRVLHGAGVPRAVLQILPGDGAVGAALVGDARVRGVVFTGSTAVARLIQGQLAGRLGLSGQPVPLIAETGGQNVLIVDSSALAEQVVGDVIASAFDSAGQRCSALRILCLQEEVADRTLIMLKGALRELKVGNPGQLSVDVGPVISAEAREGIVRHIEAMRARGHRVHQAALSEAALDKTARGKTALEKTGAHGTFVAPTIIEIGRIKDVEREVFGPVLHVLRYRRTELDGLIDEVNGSGYGLTFGLHTRIDETVARVVGRVRAGNVYVNRNIIGAVVGVQPFGGVGLSGTGPKAGGPLYLGRLLAEQPDGALDGVGAGVAETAPAEWFAEWLRAAGREEEAARCAADAGRSVAGATMVLPGPVGERNVYMLEARGRVGAVADAERGLLLQIGAILATGNVAVVAPGPQAAVLSGLPRALREWVGVESVEESRDVQAVLFDGDRGALASLCRRVAAWDGPIVPVLTPCRAAGGPGSGYELERLLEERCVSTNTAAAGGNASLMSLV